MAVNTVIVQNAALTGLATSFEAANAGGNKFLNTGRELLIVKNGGGGNVVVTIAATVQCNQGILHNQAVTVLAGATEIIGTFPGARFNDATGYVTVTYDGVGSVTIAVIKV